MRPTIAVSKEEMIAVNFQAQRTAEISMMEMQSIFVETLTETSNLIKNGIKACFNQMPIPVFTINEARNAVIVASRKAIEKTSTELHPMLYTKCEAIKGKYGKNHQRVLRHLDRFDGREVTVYAISIMLEKLLNALRDKTISDCFDYLDDTQKSGQYAKHVALAKIIEISDNVCTEITGMAYII